MGMTIEEVVRELKWTLKVHKEILETDAKEIDVDSAWIRHWESVTEALNIAINTMLTYDRLRTDYENRLKADMVAILEDFDLQIDEFDSGCGWDGYIKKIDVHEIIQQKINALKGE